MLSLAQLSPSLLYAAINADISSNIFALVLAAHKIVLVFVLIVFSMGFSVEHFIYTMVLLLVTGGMMLRPDSFQNSFP